ncbi:MAG: hypothetical protein RR889_01750 [Akkermansia sp.]
MMSLFCTMKHITSIFCVLACIFTLSTSFAQTAIPSQSETLEQQDNPFVRIIKNSDGSRSKFERTPDLKGGMKKEMSDQAGNLMSVTLYRTGKWGHLTSCKIYDGKNTELYKVAYGYDKKNGNLVQERMFESKTGKLVRVFVYTYDELGNRSKPIAITYVKGLDLDKNSKFAAPSAPEKDPFADTKPNSDKKK